MMHKFRADNGDLLYAPSVACHLPSAEIRLLSPQSHHQRHGGRSEALADRVVMHLPRQGDSSPQHDVAFPIEQNGSNLPMVGGMCCTEEERERVGPHLCSGIAKHLLRLGFYRSWHVGSMSLNMNLSRSQRCSIHVHRMRATSISRQDRRSCCFGIGNGA